MIHTHAALAHKARQMVSLHALTEDDVVMVPTPLAHISGVLYALLVPIAVPMRAVLMGRWDSDVGAGLIEAEGCPETIIGRYEAASGGPQQAL